MSNPILDACRQQIAQGYHPWRVDVTRQIEDAWLVEITLDDWVPGGEGGDSLPAHVAYIDRRALRRDYPQVTLRDTERCEDSRLRVEAKEYEIRDWLMAVARESGATEITKGEAVDPSIQHLWYRVLTTNWTRKGGGQQIKGDTK